MTDGKTIDWLIHVRVHPHVLVESLLLDDSLQRVAGWRTALQKRSVCFGTCKELFHHHASLHVSMSWLFSVIKEFVLHCIVVLIRLDLPHPWCESVWRACH